MTPEQAQVYAVVAKQLGICPTPKTVFTLAFFKALIQIKRELWEKT